MPESSILLKQHARIHSKLVVTFEKLASIVTQNYLWFIFVPIVFWGLTSTGLIGVSPSRDLASLALPENSEWSEEKNSVEAFFGNSEDTNLLRTTNIGQYLHLIVTTKNDSNLLTADAWSETLQAEQRIRESFISYGQNVSLTFEDLCTKWRGKCFPTLIPVRPDFITSLGSFVQRLPSFLSLNNITFPYFLPSMEFYIGYNLGEPRFRTDGILESTRAISIYYLLDSKNETSRER